MRGQVRALRELALVASREAISADGRLDVGSLLSSNMCAGLAIELALKCFFMTFREQPPPGIHRVHALFEELPPAWRAEMERAYKGDPRRNADVRIAAFQNAPTPPTAPAHAPSPHEFASIEQALLTLNTIFHDSRYFYEFVGAGEWSIVDHPIEQMLAIIDVLTSMYEHLLNLAAEKAEPE